MNSIGKIGYNFLGKSGLKVSNLCFGAMTFGDKQGYGLAQANEKEAHTLLDRFVEWGGNFIDTADVYAEGKSEEYVGSWLVKQNRDDFVISTKMFHGQGPANQNCKGLSRVNILRSIEGSLKRLQTSFVDVYHIHCWDDATPLEETLGALNDLVRSGKVRYVAASNVTGWQLQKILDVTKDRGWDQWICLQQQWSLLARESEFEVFEVCRREGVGVLPWSPLKGGWLSGKYKRDMTDLPANTRLNWVKESKQANQSHPSYEQFSGNEKVWNILDLLQKYAQAYDKTVPQVAIKWLLQKSIVSSVVIGARTIAQLDDNMGAGTDWKLTAEQMTALDEVSAPEVPYPYEMVWRVNKGLNRGRLPPINTC